MTTKLLRLALAGAAALAVAACGSAATGSGEPAAAAGSPPSTSASQPGPLPPAGSPTSGRPVPPTSAAPPKRGGPGGGANVPGAVVLVPGKQVDTSRLPSFGKAPVVYAGDGGRTLQIVIGPATGCATTQAVLREQNAAGVSIALVPLDTPQGGEHCGESMKQHPILVHLDAPLGTRTVYLSASR